ncbi:MAG: hypothetical protein ACT4OO_04775 [Nitrospiraceae bacterium]
MLLDEIRTGIHDSSPTVRMWASLIVELGRQSSAPYDLLIVTDLDEVRLNGLQQVLMLKHLAAEFFALAIERATKPAVSRLGTPSRSRSVSALTDFNRAWVIPRARLAAHADQAVPGRTAFPTKKRRVSSFQPGDPCGFGADEGTATSRAASGWGWSLKTIFGPLRKAVEDFELLDYYKKLGEAVDKDTTDAFVQRMKAIREIKHWKGVTADIDRFMKTVSKLHNIATALLSLAEAAVVMHAVKIDIGMTPSPPLVRTKTREPGEITEVSETP